MVRGMPDASTDVELAIVEDGGPGSMPTSFPDDHKTHAEGLCVSRRPLNFTVLGLPRHA